VNNKVSRILGLAFLWQAITSLVSGAVLETKWYVEGNIGATLVNINDQPWLLKMNIFVDVLTALGIIFLGGMLYLYLRKINEKMALVGFGFYILEAILIAASRMNVFPLLDISKEYVTGGQTAALAAMGSMAYDSSHFAGMTLTMLAFCAGAIPLYYLLFKSSILPKWLSFIGLVTVFPCLAGTLISLFSGEASMAWFAAYMPFEFVVAVWILVAGVKLGQETASLPVTANAKI